MILWVLFSPDLPSSTRYPSTHTGVRCYNGEMDGREVLTRAAGVGFGYEALALVSGLPSLSRLSARYRWLKPALLVLLALHLWPPYLLGGPKP